MKSIRSTHRRRGAALVISLVAVALIAGLGAALIQVQSIMTKKQSFSIDRRAALYIAEAGLAEASLAVSQGKSGIIASENVPARFGRGVYWVESSDLPGDRLALVCTARVGTAEFMLRTVALPNLNPVSSLGFFGADGVELGWGTVVDGFHSTVGDHAGLLEPGLSVPATGGGGRVGSNSDIVLVETVSAELVDPRAAAAASSGAGGSLGTTSGGGSAGTVAGSGGGTASGGGSWGSLVASSGGSGSGSGSSTGGTSGGKGTGGSAGGVTSLPGDPTWIFGFLRPGPRSSVRSSGFSMLKGRIVPMRYPRSLPAVQIPPSAEVLPGDLVVSTSVHAVGSLVETEVLGHVRVAAGGVLTLVGPKVLTTSRLVVDAGGTLIIDDDNGPVDLFLRGGLTLASGSTLLSTGSDVDSRGTTITLAEAAGGRIGRVTIESTGSFHGILYAPSDDVTIPSGLHWRGSAVARLLRTAPGARITFDERLSIGGLGVPTLPRLLSWQIVPIGNGTARQLSVDPLLELALRGVTPVQSAAAAPESAVEIDYVNLAGAGATYTGPIAGFSPAAAQRIIGTSWDDPRGGPARRFLRPAGDDPAGAIASARATNRFLRAAIRSITADPRVGFLTDDETVDLISSLPAAEIATQAPEVIAADDRVGRADAMAGATMAPFDPTLWMDDVTTKDDTGAATDDVNANGAITVDGKAVTDH